MPGMRVSRWLVRGFESAEETTIRGGMEGRMMGGAIAGMGLGGGGISLAASLAFDAVVVDEVVEGASKKAL